MSLAELTRNCFQSGISPSKWLSLCRLLISKQPTVLGSVAMEESLSNSVLLLYRFYPGDPDLQDYLKYAIQEGLLSVAVFVATLLQAARSPELHAPATLDTLCRIALDAHYSSGLPPIGSVVPFDESPITILATVQDALVLLRTAHSLPMSHFHQLTTSASELLILLLSCISDISQVSTAQAMVHFAEANDLFQNFRLAPDVRQVLETFILSLSLIIGDDAKAAREAQIMHTIQLALGKGDILGPSSDTDIITFGLVVQQLVSHSAHDFGSGDDSRPVALLVGIFRWVSWAPTVFYTQLLIATFACMAQSNTSVLTWKAFVVGRLPHLLMSFEHTVNADGVSISDWRRAIQVALLTASRRHDLITQCDRAIARTRGAPAQEDENPRSFFRDLLQQMIQVDLITQPFAVELDPLIINDNLPRLQTEAQDIGLDLESYLESKIWLDTGIDDPYSWIERILKDIGSHKAFANIVLKRFTSLAGGFDVEPLSYLCKFLFKYEVALDIIALHIKISHIIFLALSFLEHYDCETVGDPQTAVSHLGDVVVFVQYTTCRFHLDAGRFTKENRTLYSNYLTSTDTVHPMENLTIEDNATFNAWFKALFDSSSEGIEDTILRSTQPKTLLRISATLLSQAIKSSHLQKIDGDVLNNGVSYFTGPLLNWTLVGILKALLREITEKGFVAPTHFDILQTLVLSTSCPRPILAICAPQILSVIGDKRLKTTNTTNIDVESIRGVIAEAIGYRDAGPQPGSAPTLWRNGVGQILRNTFALARSGKVPVLDVERCIRIIPPSKFLHSFWSELVVSASLGEMESCRRIAAFVLTMPRSSNTPPLLPIFLHNVSPLLIAAIDKQQPTERSIDVELLVTVVSSVLTAALHLELAMRSITGEDVVLGQASVAMARRFAITLRTSKNSLTSRMVMQRLASSQSFVANFPVFMGELG